MRHASRPRAAPSLFRLLARGIRLILGVGTVLCIVAVVAVYIFAATNTARLVPVMSNSMAPDMPVGALALTVPVGRADVKVGDVIVFTDPDRPTIRVIHRIVHIFGPDEAEKFSNWSPDQLTASTKGDNNPTADPWILTVADTTIWRMDRSVDYLGQPAIWFETPIIRLWGFGAAGIALVCWLLALVWRRPKAGPVAR
jgi:signal peptidase